MHLGSAHFLDVAGRWVMQAVQALPASFGSSLRPVSTSNGAGSRAAGSRGPWSSAELATRPVRKGPPKPKGNAPDSRKTRTSNHRIPGEGMGLSLPNFGSPSSAPLVDRKKSRVREPSQANRVPAWLRLLPLSRPLRRPCQTRPPAPCPNGVLAPGA